MQREPRSATAQACFWEHRALSVPKKQPRGDFHSIGPNTAAAGRASLGLWKEPRDWALHGRTERTLCYEVLCGVKPTVPEHHSVLLQGNRRFRSE